MALMLAAAICVHPAYAGKKSSGPESIGEKLSGHRVCDSRGGTGAYHQDGRYVYSRADGTKGNGSWTAVPGRTDQVYVQTDRGSDTLTFTPTADQGFDINGWVLGSFNGRLC